MLWGVCVFFFASQATILNPFFGGDGSTTHPESFQVPWVKSLTKNWPKTGQKLAKNGKGGDVQNRFRLQN